MHKKNDKIIILKLRFKLVQNNTLYICIYKIFSFLLFIYLFQRPCLMFMSKISIKILMRNLQTYKLFSCWMPTVIYCIYFKPPGACALNIGHLCYIWLYHCPGIFSLDCTVCSNQHLQMLYFLLLSFIPRLDSSQFYHLFGDRGGVITSEWQMISRSRH